MNWKEIFLRELRYIFVLDRRRAIFILGASLAYLFLFSALYSTHTINHIPFAVFDEDQTALSRQLVQGLDDSERTYITSYAASQEELEAALREKKVYAGLYIPQDFAKHVKMGDSANVLLMLNGSNIMITNFASGAVQEVVKGLSSQTAAKLAESTNGQLPYSAENKTTPISFTLRVLNNPTQSYLVFFVIGLAIAAFQQGIFLAVGAAVQADKHLFPPCTRATALTLVCVKLLPYFFLSITAFFLTIFTAVHVIGIPCVIPLSHLLLPSIAFSFAAIGFSALLAAVCRDEVAFTRISIFYTVPAFILSSYTWPIEAMDPAIQSLPYVFPLFYVSNTVRDLLLSGYSPSLYQNSFVLFSMGFACILLAALYCRLYADKQSIEA